MAAGQRFNGKAAYVSLSRARHSAALFTPDKNQLLQRDRPPRQRFLPTGKRPAAADVLAPAKVNVVAALQAKEAPRDPRLRVWWTAAQTWVKRAARQSWREMQRQWERHRFFANPHRLQASERERVDGPSLSP